MQHKAITFDFWDTLFTGAEGDERHAVRLDALAEVVGDRELAEDAYARAVGHFDRIYRRHHRTVSAGHLVGFVEKTFRLKLDKTTRNRLIKVWEEAVLATSRELTPGAAEAVRAAAEHHCIGLVCDTGMTPGSVLRRILSEAGLCDLFAAFSFSDEVGVSKPRPEIFEHACAKLRVKPSELLHIGDTEWSDVAGAHAAGAKAGLFVGVSDRYLKGSKADYVFRSWAEFVEFIREQDRQSRAR